MVRQLGLRPKARGEAAAFLGLAAVTARRAEAGYGREDVGPGGEDPEGRYSWTRHGMTVLVKAPIGLEVNRREIQATFAQRKAKGSRPLKILKAS